MDTAARLTSNIVGSDNATRAKAQTSSKEHDSHAVIISCVPRLPRYTAVCIGCAPWPPRYTAVFIGEAAHEAEWTGLRG